jgi:hypothetical protein
MRPNVERNIIPTTWRENGVGLFGQLGSLAYKAYVINGFQAVKDFAVTGSSGNVKGDTMPPAVCGTGVKKGPAPWPRIGGGWDGWIIPAGPVCYWVGPLFRRRGSGAMVSGQELKAKTTLWETHAECSMARGGTSGALFAHDCRAGRVDQRGAGLHRRHASVGERMWGSYGQLAYNVLARRKGFVSGSFLPL